MDTGLGRSRCSEKVHRVTRTRSESSRQGVVHWDGWGTPRADGEPPDKVHNTTTVTEDRGTDFGCERRCCFYEVKKTGVAENSTERSRTVFPETRGKPQRSRVSVLTRSRSQFQSPPLTLCESRRVCVKSDVQLLWLWVSPFPWVSSTTSLLSPLLRPWTQRGVR